MLQRNKSSQFSLLPQANIQRSVFDRSSSHKFTFNVGELIPFYVDEVLPGSTHQIRTSKMVRLQTPATPFMDDLYLDTYYFFVPNRLVWDDWQNFQGQNDKASWIPLTDYTVPQIELPSFNLSGHEGKTFFAIGSVADYMGLPSGNLASQTPLLSGVPDPIPYKNSEAISFNALPLRCYSRIFNDWFRDQNLSDPLWIPKTNTTYTGIYDSSNFAVNESVLNNGNPLNRCTLGGRPAKVSKYHDYFTSALPSPLKGEDVKVPIVSTNTSTDPLFLQVSQGETKYYINRNSSGTLETSTILQPTNALTLNGVAALDNSGISINDLRLAFATQAQYERDARGGTRYTEILRSNFGVISPDASLQRSQYLGGNHFRINVNQVVQQAGGDGFLGDVAAFSATADSNGDFIQSFTEHGFIIGVCCARYNHSYQEGSERFWFRKKRFDYYMPAFANIGEQPINYREIYIDPGKQSDGSSYSPVAPSAVFGYQEAWSEYRMKPNRVSGEMRSNCNNTLDYWHLADHYGFENAPHLSDGWIREDTGTLDRVLTVAHSQAHQIFADFYIDNKTTQPIPMYSIPATLGGNF